MTTQRESLAQKARRVRAAALRRETQMQCAALMCQQCDATPPRLPTRHSRNDWRHDAFGCEAWAIHELIYREARP